MRPRLVFVACLVVIVAFGTLMIYSASSVEALKYGSSLYFVTRHVGLLLAGAVCCVLLAVGWPFKLSSFEGKGFWLLWTIIIVSLVVVAVAGKGSRGATRWLNLGIIQLQPSEFAKPVLILLGARLFGQYFFEGTMPLGSFLSQLVIGVGGPLGLIIFQPDFGTTVIIVSALVVMALMAGMPLRYFLVVACVGVLAAVCLVVFFPYRMRRFEAMMDPWSDPYGNGLQATRAIMAFASGGLFGRGIGNATMKYNYLPEAHNDYILAIIGEELGYVGTVVMIAIYLVMLYAAFQIALRAPRMYGRLVAAGATALIGVQFFINALGILGAIPMTGKPLPFISYGGSSIIASLILAGLIIRVSMESNPATVYDARRAGLSVVGADEVDVSDHIGRSTAGEPRVRGTATAHHPGFSVYDGGSAGVGASGVSGRGPARTSGVDRAGGASGRWSRGSVPLGGPGGPGGHAGHAGRYGRVDLNADPTGRLRTEGPRAGSSGSASSGRSGRGSSGRGTAGFTRRDQYER